MTWHAAIGFKEEHERNNTQAIILLDPRGVETGVVPSKDFFACLCLLTPLVYRMLIWDPMDHL